MTSVDDCRRQFASFRSHHATGFLTSEEAEKLRAMAMQPIPKEFMEMTGKKHQSTSNDSIIIVTMNVSSSPFLFV